MKSSPYLSVTPLGGVGEIGSNCTVFENDEEMVIVDYGILFPYEDFFDIDYLIADLETIKNTDKKVTIFITHGHEDHIGAIVHINKVFPNAIIHAPQFAEKLMRRKLQEQGQAAQIQTYTEKDELEFKNFTIHPVKVTHSIPDTYGLIVHEKNGAFNILFISDFKYDLDPLYEAPFNAKKIKDLFSSGAKNFAMMDSTNILNPGSTPSEKDLVPALSEIVGQDRRIFITLFSSNIHRLRTIFNLAKEKKKRVVTIGRSIKSYVEVAKECGLFGDELSVLMDEREVTDPQSKRHIYLLTGCQGDHFGALRRVSSGEHKYLSPQEDDLFVFSSKAIPGNEKKVNRIYNVLTEAKAQVITNRDALVHASGHPSQEDLAALYKEISPDVIIPIHGESYFLRKHVEWIKDNELASEAHYIHNFTKLCFDQKGEMKLEKIEEDSPLIIHGNKMIIEREAISKRRKLACNGACFISVDSKSRRLALTTSGLPNSLDNNLGKITNLVKGQLSKKLMTKDEDYIAEEIRVFTRNLLKNFLGYRPIVFVHIL